VEGIIIIRLHTQQRSVASTWNAHDRRPWTIQRGCQKGYSLICCIHE